MWLTYMLYHLVYNHSCIHINPRVYILKLYKFEHNCTIVNLKCAIFYIMLSIFVAISYGVLVVIGFFLRTWGEEAAAILDLCTLGTYVTWLHRPITSRQISTNQKADWRRVQTGFDHLVVVGSNPTWRHQDVSVTFSSGSQFPGLHNPRWRLSDPTWRTDRQTDR